MQERIADGGEEPRLCAGSACIAGVGVGGGSVQTARVLVGLPEAMVCRIFVASGTSGVAGSQITGATTWIMG